MNDLLFEYKVRAIHRLGWKEFSFYATTKIEEFLNRNSIDYVRNMTDTVENRLFKENKRLNNIINELESQLQQKENIIKEVRDYIKLHIRKDEEYPDYMEMLKYEYKELLEIIDKINKEK